MTTLLQLCPPVQSAWWAADVPDHPESEPAPLSDAAWLADELVRYEHGAAALDGSDRYRAAELRFVASILAQICGSMAFNRVESASDYCRTLSGRAFAGTPRLPRTGSLRAPLAQALATEAAWYAHLDTPAGDLVAAALLDVAGDAERWGCWVPDDLVVAEAAYHAAMADALADDDGEECPW